METNFNRLLGLLTLKKIKLLLIVIIHRFK